MSQKKRYLRPDARKTILAALILIVSFSTQAQWNVNGTNIYYNGPDNIGVGTNTPIAKFQVYGGDAYLWGLNLGFGTSSSIINADQGNKPIVFQQAGTERARIHSNGWFGIGTNNPLGPLQVYGGNTYLWGLNIGYGTGIAVITSDVSNKPISFQLAGTEYARISAEGNFLIGKTSQTNTAYKLDVNGLVRAQKIVVNTTGADYVFDPAYKLPSLPSVEKYITENHHLPGIASAKKMQEEGMEVSDNQTLLLSKVEELTLYVIRQNKEIESLKAQLKKVKAQIKK